MSHRAPSLFSGLPQRASSIVLNNLSATQILYADSNKKAVGSANLTYDAANIRLSVGTGTGASTGYTIGNTQSGYAGLAPTGVTLGSSIYSLQSKADNSEVYLNAATGGFIWFGLGGSTEKMRILGAAGAGPAITAGTAASAVRVGDHSQTRNFSGGATDGYLRYVFTETATHASDTYETILAGSAGTSPVRVMPLGGGLTLGSTGLTAAQGTSQVKLSRASTTLSGVTGASVTATNLVPAKANVMGVNTVVTTALGTGSGTTGYTVGDGSDADRWGAVTGTAAGTDTDGSDATADPTGFFTAANNVVITAAGGNFDGTGAIFVEVWYFVTAAT